MKSPGHKFENLRDIIRNYQKVIVAFSGGVDSTFLLKVCVDVLGNQNVIAVTGVSDSYTKEEHRYARLMTDVFGVRYIQITTNEITDPNFATNPPDRCYYCKKTLYAELKNLAQTHRVPYILDASNLDDIADYRPGRQAAAEYDIQSPLIEAGITKSDIRRYSRLMGLSSWQKPANPCLASRIPYGNEITTKRLRMIEEAEKFIRSLGFATVRVRHHGEIARIEILPQDFHRFLYEHTRTKIATRLRRLGFAWIALDTEGYRTGSLNEVLRKKEISK